MVKYKDIFDQEGLGLKFRAHPLALAIAKVSLETLDFRIRRTDEFRERVTAKIKELPGLEPEFTYPKAKRISLYGGVKIFYNPQEFEGLPCEVFVEALKAEGVPVIRGPGSTQKLQHLKPVFKEGFDLWGRGRSPIKGRFLGLPAYRGYKEGDFPVAERLSRTFFTLPTYIEPREGFVSQIIEAFYKVVSHYKDLFSLTSERRGDE